MRRSTVILAFLAVAGACALALFGGATRAQAARAKTADTRKALIDADTVSGSPSEEEQFATAAGFSVTVASDADWAAMTAADFGQYDLLIAGDPDCGSLPPGLVSSAAVWGPVVLGHAGGRTNAGNRIVVGTDPVLHSAEDPTSPRSTVIRDGIAFAGAQPGTTGMYFDTTCAANYFGQSDETLSSLAAISEGSGSWTLDSTPPCGGSVSLIAANPAFTDLTTDDLQGWGCSVHESFPTFPSDWSALAVATDTATQPTCGVDPNTGLSACGEAYILVAGSSIVVTSSAVSLTPADATETAGTSHTVTAYVHSGGTPLAGKAVTFSVTGINAGATGTCDPVDCTSGADGKVSFTYSDASGLGDDTVKASFTDDAGSLQSATAQVHWTLASATVDSISASCAGNVLTATANAHGDPGATFTLTLDKSDDGSTFSATDISAIITLTDATSYSHDFDVSSFTTAKSFKVVSDGGTESNVVDATTCGPGSTIPEAPAALLLPLSLLGLLGVKAGAFYVRRRRPDES